MLNYPSKQEGVEGGTEKRQGGREKLNKGIKECRYRMMGRKEEALKHCLVCRIFNVISFTTPQSIINT